jgi:hypothetical protein
MCPFTDHEGYGGVTQVMNTEIRRKSRGLDGWVPNVTCEVRVTKWAAVGHREHHVIGFGTSERHQMIVQSISQELGHCDRTVAVVLGRPKMKFATYFGKRLGRRTCAGMANHLVPLGDCRV